MEQRNKSQISTVLMVVGVIFILVAGSIFVTTAWKYLPEFVKQLMLLVVAAGLFVGSAKVTKGGKLQKSEKALFYLGTAFTGFYVIAAMGGLADDALYPQLNAFKMMMASLVMLIPVGIRLAAHKKGFEYSVAAVLADGFLFWMGAALEMEMHVFAVLFAVLLMVYAGVDYYRRKSYTINEGLDLSAAVVYLVHVVIYIPLSLVGIMAADFYSGLLPAFLALVPVILSGITYKAENKTIFRILNSTAIFWFVYILCGNVNVMLQQSNRLGLAFLAAFVISMVIMLLMDREEMEILWGGIGLFIPFVQSFLYLLMFNKPQDYIPFSFVMAAGAFLLHVKAKREENEIDGRYFWTGCLQVINGLLMWAASKDSDILLSTGNILMVVALVTVAFWVTNQTAKSILWTIALCFGEIAAWTQHIVSVPEGYEAEWICAFIGLGIVLLPFLWYDKKKDLEMVQFIMTCWVLGILLLHNLASGGLGNVLFLGMVAIAILLLAAIYNQKKYVITASVTLILLVLYLTRSFWLSIAWWVYLFVAGVALVILAIKKEKEA